MITFERKYPVNIFETNGMGRGDSAYMAARQGSNLCPA
jgi:hypothetical protein